MRNYHVILRVADNGRQLNHVPLAQYWLIRYEIGTSQISQLTLTMPRIDSNGNAYPKAPIALNIDSFLNGNGFSNADISRWLQSQKYKNGTLLLFKVTFKNNHLDYSLVGKVNRDF